MTDAERDRSELERFFLRRLRPLSRHGAWRSSPRGPDPAAASYYCERNAAPMSRADFEIEFSDERAIGRSLDAYWRSTLLAGLGRRLARLSRRFRGREEKEEVSSYVYEMF